jgi:hypothetical protein
MLLGFSAFPARIAQLPRSWAACKPLILLNCPDAQVPKGLIPCVGGHGIAFIYPLIPCKAQLCSLSGNFKRRSWIGAPKLGKQEADIRNEE